MLIKFICNNSDCNNEISKFFKTISQVPPFLDCGACGCGKMERHLSSPSSKSTFVIDNGHQAKEIEVLSEVIDREFERTKTDK